MAAAAVYDMAVLRFVESSTDWENDEFRVMLLTPDYVPRQSRDRTVSDIERFEVSPAGTYRSGGISLPERAADHDGTAHRVSLRAGNVEWFEFTGVFRYAVIYQAAGDGNLIAYTDFGDQAAKNATVSIDYSAGVCDFDAVPATRSFEGVN